MKLDSRWMWIGGVLAAAVLALVAGIPLGTLLIVAALLACPAAMYFGMRGHQSASGMSLACHGKSDVVVVEKHRGVIRYNVREV